MLHQVLPYFLVGCFARDARTPRDIRYTSPKVISAFLRGRSVPRWSHLLRSLFAHSAYSRRLKQFRLGHRPAK